MPAFGVGPLLLGTTGILLMCPVTHTAALERRGARRARVPVGAGGTAFRCIRWRPTASPLPFVVPGDVLLVLASGRDTSAVKKGSPPMAIRARETSLREGALAAIATATLANGRLVAYRSGRGLRGGLRACSGVPEPA